MSGRCNMVNYTKTVLLGVLPQVVAILSSKTHENFEALSYDPHSHMFSIFEAPALGIQ